MPNLTPDTSIYSKNQLSIVDLLNIAKTGRQLQTQQTQTGLVGKNTDPDTGTFDAAGYNRDLGAAARTNPNLVISPTDVTEGNQAADQQLNTDIGRMTKAGKLLSPFLDLPPDQLTQKTIGPTLGIIQRLKVPAHLIAPVLQARDGKELHEALINLNNALVGPQVPSVEIPGQAGVAGGLVTPGVASRIPGGGGILGSTDIPKGMSEDQQKAATFTDRTQPIVNLISTVRKMGPNDFGPSSEGVNTIRKLASYWGVKLPPELLDKSVNYDKAQKAMVQIATEAGMGGTDLSTLQAIHGNPNVNMQSATIEELAKTLYAQHAKQAAVFPLAAKLGVTNAQYDNFKIWANKNLDARAFGFQMMSPESQKKLLSGMSKKEIAKFEKSLDVADQFMDKPPEGGWYVPHE